MSFLTASLLLVAAPAGPSKIEWRWAREPGVCALRQQSDDAGGVLEISRSPGSGTTSVMLLDRANHELSWKPVGTATLTLDPGGSIIAESYLGSSKLSASRGISVTSADPQFIAQLANASALTVSQAEFGSRRVPVRSSVAAVRAIQECEAGLLKEWGIDPSSTRDLRSRPKPLNSQIDWFSSGDYPRLAAIYGVGAFVVALLDVGPDGRVASCKVVNRQQLTDFKDVVCESLRREARFQPAVGADGQPASAPYIVRVRFQPNR